MKLIHGNCLDHLDERADLILSDPPYNIGFSYNEYDDSMSNASYVEMLSKFCHPRRTVFIQYPEETMRYLVPALGVPKEVMVWCYNSNIGRQSRLINFFNCEPDKRKVLQPYKNPKDKRVAALIKGGVWRHSDLRLVLRYPACKECQQGKDRSSMPCSCGSHGEDYFDDHEAR